MVQRKHSILMAWHYDQDSYVDIKEAKFTTKCNDLAHIPCNENESYPKTT